MNNQNYSDDDYQLRLDASTFFHERKGFDRLFTAMRDKYISLSHIGGNVTVNQPNAEEYEELSRYFSKMYNKNSTIQFSLKAFEEVLQQTKFQGISLKELLEVYFNEEIETREMKTKRLAMQKEQFFQRYLEKHQEKYASLWIHGVRAGEISGSNQLNRLLAQEATEQAIMWMDFTLKMIESLLRQLSRQSYKRLPFFAQEVTRDPHGLDRNEINYSAFLMTMQWLVTQEAVGTLVENQINETTLESTNELLNQFYLYKDDIANFVSVYGFEGFLEDGKQCEWLVKAAEATSALNVPLREVNRLGEIQAYKDQPVVLIENSGVYSQLLSSFSHGISFICVHGQPNLATLKFIDLVNKNHDTPLYYAGDFDPEGLLIAQNLVKRYPRLQTIWQKYSFWYQKESTSQLNVPRINKLKNIDHPQLVEASKLLQKNRVPFYQEQFMPAFEQLVKDKIIKKQSILE